AEERLITRFGYPAANRGGIGYHVGLDFAQKAIDLGRGSDVPVRSAFHADAVDVEVHHTMIGKEGPLCVHKPGGTLHDSGLVCWPESEEDASPQRMPLLSKRPGDFDHRLVAG